MGVSPAKTSFMFLYVAKSAKKKKKKKQANIFFDLPFGNPLLT